MSRLSDKARKAARRRGRRRAIQDFFLVAGVVWAGGAVIFASVGVLFWFLGA